MEGYQRESTRTLIVERAFEWSRLEDKFMMAAYESVMPFIGPSAGAVGEEIEPDPCVEGKRDQRMVGA
jgi:hypothetical protein